MAHAAIEPAESQPAMVRVHRLSADYGPFAALRDVDLDIGAGEIVGVAGDNGAGKSTLLRCLCGDVADARGEVRIDDEPVSSRTPSDRHGRIGVVWQHLVLSDNLDAAETLLLGRESRRLLESDARFHARARTILDDLGIQIGDLERPVGTLTTGQRQLLAIARAVSPRPRLLLLDEPTAALNRPESAQVEQLIRRFHDEGSTIVLVSHDVEQLLRLTQRVVVLRHGRVAAQVDPAGSHPDEVLALMSGHDPSSAPRHQLTRLHGLADQLSSAERPASDDPAGLDLILSTLGAALGTVWLSLHLVEGTTLRRASSLGLPGRLDGAWAALPLESAPAPLRQAVAQGAVAVETDVGDRQSPHTALLTEAGIAGWWAVPFSSSGGVTGVISVYRRMPGPPTRDEVDLVNLYAGYAASAVERDRLLTELTARNTLLETIRSVLQTLAGPDSLADGLNEALHILRDAAGADAVGLYARSASEPATCRTLAGAVEPSQSAGELAQAAEAAMSHTQTDGAATVRPDGRGGSHLCVRLPQADSVTVLVARWAEHLAGADNQVLFEDAAHSVLLALERERTEAAHREATALRRTQQLQRDFLARLSHELRTPLTAIRGYASSLMQTDVEWDAASQHRFLSRISSESARLRRLVDDLLDFSLMESGMLHLRPDWVDLPLVIDAARSCLSPRAARAVEVRSASDLPVIWADHDRLEQVLMNLMDNAVRHNPAGTSVRVQARRDGPDRVLLEISDDGVGLPNGHGREGVAWSARPRGASAGAGLGLSITRAIVEAHHGTLRRAATDRGTRFLVRLPVEADDLDAEVIDG